MRQVLSTEAFSARLRHGHVLMTREKRAIFGCDATYSVISIGKNYSQERVAASRRSSSG